MNNLQNGLLVKLFIYKNRYFLYDTFQNYLIEITKSHFGEISKIANKQMELLPGEKLTKEGLDIAMLKNRGFLKTSVIDRVENPNSPHIGDMLLGCINDLVLQVTQRCNFNCRYCLYAGNGRIERTHSSLNMPTDIAIRSIDYLYEHSYDSPSIHISYYGGEPLLNYDLICWITKYAQSRFISKKINFSLTTNGALFNKDNLDFFEKNDFKISVSLDGPQVIQDKHRRMVNGLDGTYSTVYSNLQLIKNQYPAFFKKNIYFLPVVIDDEDYNIVKEYFDSEGIAPEKVSPLKANLNGIDYYLSASNINNSSLKTTEEDSGGINEPSFNNLYNVYKNKSPISRVWHHNGQCIPGLQRLFVDVNGYFYPCEKIIESEALHIGSVYDGIDQKKVLEFANIGKLTNEDCKHCWALRFCELCVSQCVDCGRNTITNEVKKRACQSQREKALWTLKKIIDRQR